MHPFTLAADALAFDTGTTLLFTDLDLTVGPRTRLGIVGPNGSGKSTLLGILAGRLAPTTGSVERQPASTTVLLLEQEAPSDAETVRSHLARRTGVSAAVAALEQASAALAQDHLASVGDSYSRALARFLSVGADDFAERLPAALDEIGLTAGDADRSVGSLSRGQATRVQLAVLVLARADVLLLDEPTNDLDADGLAKLDRLIDGYRGAICLVSHDRAFLERSIDEVLELGPQGPTYYRGGWNGYRTERDRNRRLATEAWERDREQRDALVARARRQREWAARGVGVAKRSPDPDKFVRHGRIQSAQNHGASASRLDRALERRDTPTKPWEGWDLRFDVDTIPKGSRRVALLHDVAVERDGVVVGPHSLEISWGERIRLSGPNGAGKTTLVDVLRGRVQPTSGDRHLGPSTIVGEVGQRRDGALGSPTLLAWAIDATGLGHQEARALLAPFGLGAEALDRPPATLSTGERTRAELAIVQARGVNLLVLDEPTNHLDLDAMEALERALAGYRGSLLVISHDERFVERLRLEREVELPAPQGVRP